MEVRNSKKILIVNNSGWLGANKPPCNCHSEELEPLYPAGTVEENEKVQTNTKDNEIEPLLPNGIEIE
jgi:hypothetical protein